MESVRYGKSVWSIMSGICMDVRSKGRISGRLSRAKKKSIVIHEETLTEVSFCFLFDSAQPFE